MPCNVGATLWLTMISGSEPPAFRADSARSAAAFAVAAVRRRASVRELSPLARAIAAEPVSHAVSPVVLAGIVRASEFGLIAVLGAVVYAYAVYPVEGIDLRYLVADPVIAIAAIAAFQAFDIYSTTAFRSHVHQLSRLALAWTLRDGRLTSTLVGASSVAQLEDNVATVRNLQLSAGELADIDRFAVAPGTDIWA